MKQNFKKWLAMFSFLFCLFLIPISGQATYIPDHLYNNSQIQLAYYQQGVGVYVDKTSIVNEYYNPPYYKLAANIIYYNWNNGHEGILHEETSHYTYNINADPFMLIPVCVALWGLTMIDLQEIPLDKIEK